jgi:AcrR family transcriptional regulator
VTQLEREPAATPLGLRERNKADKLLRIRQAAHELFTEKGYDHTTTREIARRADVGLGTLFSYATDKRDLLFLIFNAEIEQVFAEGERAAREKTLLIDQLIAFFRFYYRFFARQPALSRFMLRELTFYADGTEALRFQKGRDNLLRCLGELVAQAQSAGRIGSREAPALIAQALFATYAAELRGWIGAETPDLEDGLVRLRRMLALLFRGLEPHEGAL